MKEQIAEYVISLYRDIPMAVYEGLLSVLCLGTVAIIVCYGLKRSLKWIVGLQLVEYIFLIFCSTLIYRKGYEGAGYELSPFWSYTAIQEGRIHIIRYGIGKSNNSLGNTRKSTLAITIRNWASVTQRRGSM